MMEGEGPFQRALNKDQPHLTFQVGLGDGEILMDSGLIQFLVSVELSVAPSPIGLATLAQGASTGELRKPWPLCNRLRRSLDGRGTATFHSMGA
jgi:hypothetical protein